MFRTLMKLSDIRIAAVLLAISVAVLTGCAQSAAVKQTESDVTQAPESMMITGLKTAENTETATVFIEGNGELVFTSVKEPAPTSVILYFPETALFLSDIQIESIEKSKVIESVKTSETTEKGITSRVEIVLKDDVPYDISREENGLKISFSIPMEKAAPAMTETTAAPAPAVTEMKPAPIVLPAASRITGISTDRLGEGLRVDISGNGTMKDFKTFTVSNPARIVFDIYGVQTSSTKEEQIPVDSRWVKRVRHYGYPNRVRVVLDTRPIYLSAYHAEPTASGLSVFVGKTETETMAPEPAAAATPTAVTPAAATPAAVTAAAETPTVVMTPAEGKPAWINRIDFASNEAGKSSMIIGTTAPVQYNMVKTADRRLQLKLFDVRLPAYRQRPLITTRFNSAVDRITPVQAKGEKNLTVISVELRENVPYHVEQVDNLLLVRFEASAIPPKPLDQAKLPDWKKVLTETSTVTATAPVTEEKAMPAAPEKAQAAATTMATGGKKQFTGEKIALDFYDTDIKNVFRILREISGKNFAIDKNVSGKVTLTLENPVPWDQILDLVLRMNQLGMIYEGDIVRIATLQTLAKEEELRRGNLEAKLKADEQSTALVPVETAYIPVSYANADSEIRPHLEALLSKGRGSVSVDARTNTIIMTDIPAKIKQAKELVQRLDAVTPQVIIEARIVEATTNFTRTLGITWGGTVAPQQPTGTLGGTIGYDFAVNLGPAAVPSGGTQGGGIKIDYTKIGGSPLTLTATLTALETLGEGRIISSPKVVTIDNKAARISQGTKFPYNKQDADGNTTTEFLDITLELTVTPHVTPDDRISINVKISKSDETGRFGGAGSAVPIISTKEAETELLVNDGETFVIAGIIKNNTNDSTSGIPGLHRIPLLGWLFKNNSLTENKEELLIFITPRIVRLDQRTMS